MIDKIDELILSYLVRDGRATHRELGKAVGLSPNAAGARMARLVDKGVLVGVQAVVDHAALGRPLEVMMDVWIDHRPNDDAFLALIAADSRITDAFHITGPVDFRIQARVASPEDLEDLLAKMRAEAGVTQTDSRIVMSHLPTAGSN